jgi:hypothetical protein
MSSVFNMATGIAALGERQQSMSLRLEWEDPRLIWAVREPFISCTTQAGLVCGLLPNGAELVIESMTPENGVIFSDGIEADTLEFNAGAIATIGVAAQKARLVVP